MSKTPFLSQGTYSAARQLQGGSYSGKAGDFLAHTLYDTIPYLTLGSTQTTRFFATPAGNAVTAASGSITKDAAFTNMMDASKLPAGQKFLIQSLRPEVILVGAHAQSADVAQAVIRVLQATRFRIVLPGRDFDWEAPASHLLSPIPFAIKKTVGASDHPELGVAGADFNHLYFGAPQIKLQTPIAIGDVDGAPVTFAVEHLVGTSIPNVAAALTTLGSADTEAYLRLNLIGSLSRLK